MECLEAWLTTNGRWFGVGVLQGTLVFQFVHGLLAYKALLLVLVLLSTASVYALVLRLGASRPGAALIALGATLTFQFRLYHDPILSYVGLQQLVLIEMTLSALTFDIWLRQRRRWALGVSLLLIAIASSTYDSAPLLCGLHLVVALAWRRKLVPGVLAALPALAMGTAFLALSFGLRVRYPTMDGYEAEFSAGKIAGTLGNQLSGTLPLSYVGFNPGDRFMYRGHTLLETMGVGSILAGVLVAICRRVAAARRPQRGHRAAVGRRTVRRTRRDPAARTIAADCDGRPLPGGPRPWHRVSAGLSTGLRARTRRLCRDRRRRATARPRRTGADHRARARPGGRRRPDASHEHRRRRPLRAGSPGSRVERALEAGLLDGAGPGAPMYFSATPWVSEWYSPGFIFGHSGRRFTQTVPLAPNAEIAAESRARG